MTARLATTRRRNVVDMSTTSEPFQDNGSRRTGANKNRAPPVQLHHDELARTPLTSLRTIIELVSATTTTGLTIQAAYDPNWYPKSIKITDTELSTVPPRPSRRARRVELHLRAPRGAMTPGGDERAPPLGCRSSPTKLGAA